MNWKRKGKIFKRKDNELQTYKQHSEHQQNQVTSMMVENENTLKMNNALLHKTKILEVEIKELRSHRISENGENKHETEEKENEEEGEEGKQMEILEAQIENKGKY